MSTTNRPPGQVANQSYPEYSFSSIYHGILNMNAADIDSVSFGNVCKCPELTCQPDITSIYPTKSVAIRLQHNVCYPIESGIFVQRAEKNRTRKDFLARFLVEVTGFEPATFWSRRTKSLSDCIEKNPLLTDPSRTASDRNCYFTLQIRFLRVGSESSWLRWSECLKTQGNALTEWRYLV